MDVSITQTKKYVIKTDLPFDRIRLNKGDIVVVETAQSTNGSFVPPVFSLIKGDKKFDDAETSKQLVSIFNLMSISNTEIFKPISFGTFGVGDEVIHDENVFIVKSMDFVKEEATLIPIEEKDNKKYHFYPTRKFKDLKKAHKFWFINSDGRPCSGYQELNSRKYYVAAAMGNLYDSADEARQKYAEIMHKIDTLYGVKIQ